MDRRTVLRGAMLTGAVVAAGTVSDCGGRDEVAHRRRSTVPSTTATPASGPVPWRTLAEQMDGRVVLPADPGFLVATELYNERFASELPQAVAYCAGPADVQRAVAFGRRWSLPLAVRCGGHSYGGYSTGPGLVLDVTGMAAIATAPGSARVGAGLRLIDLYAGLAEAGVTVPGGSCPTVGLAGLALGGGIGVLGRKFGLTCDNVTGLEIVTADSRLVTCGPDRNADLYWACRGGGGGNFGVVTSFELTVHPVPEVALFTLEWPWSAAAEVLGSWQGWVRAAPDELWSNCQLLSEGGAGTKVKVTGVVCGDTSALSAAIAPLVGAVGTPSYRFVGPESFLPAMLIEAGCEGLSVAECHLPSQNPSGTLQRAAFAAKSLFIDAPLPGPGIAAVVEAVDTFQAQAPGLGGAVVFDALGGAIAGVAPDATAFVHRGALADIEMSVSWSGGAPGEPAGTGPWLEGLASALAPFASGAYQNYIDPTLDDWLSAYYGANLARLRRVKRALDPDEVFRFAQSIPPAPGP